MLEAVALRLALVYDLLAPSAAADHTIVASGGAIERSRAWLQVITDAIGQPVVRSTEPEATSRGAAILALHALGSTTDPCASPAPAGERLEPDLARHARYGEALRRQQTFDRAIP